MSDLDGLYGGEPELEVEDDVQRLGHAFSMVEAAHACGVSRDSIKRKLGRFEHKWKDATGAWRIPLADLLAAGLTPNAPTEAPTAPARSEVAEIKTSSLEIELREARAQLAAYEQAMHAERARAEEAERARAEMAAALQLALQKIPASLPPAQDAAPVQTADAPGASPSAPAPPRRRWFRRT